MFDINAQLLQIESERELNQILGNFSDDFIDNMVHESIVYRFRPYGISTPNHVKSWYYYFRSIYDHYIGENTKEIDERERHVYQVAIDTIASFYHFSMPNLDDLNTNQLFTLADLMYSLFVSEFSANMINMFTNYINRHIDSLYNELSDEQKAKYHMKDPKQTDPKIKIVGGIINNMDVIVDILAGIDLNLYNIVELMADQSIAEYLTTYVAETTDTYKIQYAHYLVLPSTKTDMISCLKQSIAQTFISYNNVVNDLENNPCIATQ